MDFHNVFGVPSQVELILGLKFLVTFTVGEENRGTGCLLHTVELPVV